MDRRSMTERRIPNFGSQRSESNSFAPSRKSIPRTVVRHKNTGKKRVGMFDLPREVTERSLRSHDRDANSQPADAFFVTLRMIRLTRCVHLRRVRSSKRSQDSVSNCLRFSIGACGRTLSYRKSPPVNIAPERRVTRCRTTHSETDPASASIFENPK